MKKLDSFAIFIPISIATIAILTFLQTPENKIQTDTKASSAITPAPTITIHEEVKNPDGNKKITIIKSTNDDDTYNYDLQITDITKNTSKVIYRETLPAGYSFSAPRNSWSNDNFKFFLEKITPEGTKYYVFRSDGSSFNNGQLMLDVSEYWSKRKTSLSIEKLTGWADKDLIIIYTKNPDGSEGPSFWFVVSTRSFLQLANHPID